MSENEISWDTKTRLQLIRLITAKVTSGDSSKRDHENLERIYFLTSMRDKFLDVNKDKYEDVLEMLKENEGYPTCEEEAEFIDRCLGDAYTGRGE